MVWWVGTRQGRPPGRCAIVRTDGRGANSEAVEAFHRLLMLMLMMLMGHSKKVHPCNPHRVRIQCIFGRFIPFSPFGITKIQDHGSPLFLFLPEIDSCRAVTAGERDFFILRHGFLRGGIPIFLTVGLGGDREARQTHNGATANPVNRDRNPETGGGQEESARSKIRPICSNFSLIGELPEHYSHLVVKLRLTKVHISGKTDLTNNPSSSIKCRGIYLTNSSLGKIL